MSASQPSFPVLSAQLFPHSRIIFFFSDRTDFVAILRVGREENSILITPLWAELS